MRNIISEIRAFWYITPFILVGVDRRFSGSHCLHHRPDDGGSTHIWNVDLLQTDQKALIFMLDPVMTWNLIITSEI
jgi:hypothetical protein